MKTLTLHKLSEPALEALGARIAQSLFPGAFLALFGDLGAGKTTFTRALAAARGIRDVTSPTFTIVHESGGEPPLFHFDAYRLCAGDELYAIGFEDYLSRGGIIVMEWCENVMDALPPARLELHLAGSGLEPRTAAFSAFGTRYEAILMELEGGSQ